MPDWDPPSMLGISQNVEIMSLYERSKGDMKSIWKYFDDKKHLKSEMAEKLGVIWKLIDEENEEKD